MRPGDTLRFAYRISVAADAAVRGVRIIHVGLVLRSVVLLHSAGRHALVSFTTLGLASRFCKLMRATGGWDPKPEDRFCRARRRGVVEDREQKGCLP